MFDEYRTSSPSWNLFHARTELERQLLVIMLQVHLVYGIEPTGKYLIIAAYCMGVVST